MRHRNIRQAYLLFFFTFLLLNTHSKAFSQQQLPLLGFYAFEGDETRHMSRLRTHIKIKKQNIPPENEHLKKSWPAKIKHGWIPQT